MLTARAGKFRSRLAPFELVALQGLPFRWCCLWLPALRGATFSWSGTPAGKYGVPQAADVFTQVRLRLVDQAMMDRVEGQLQAVGNSQLVEDVVQVVLYGLLRDEELLADFLIAKTLRHQLHDFLFTIREEWLLSTRSRLRRLRESFHNLGGHAIVEPD